jgi:hypothetical protein
MATPNWITSDAFTQVSLTESFNELPFVPMQLGQSGLFSNIKRIPTKTAWIERSGKSLDLLSVSPRGSHGQDIKGDKRTGNYFDVPYIAARSEIYADEIQDVREWGSETGLKNINSEIAERQMKMRTYFEYTLEYHKLLSIQGLMMNSQNTTTSLYTEFNMTEDTVAMALGTGSTKLLSKCKDIIIHVEEGLDGLSYDAIDAYVDDEMLLKLRTHEDFEKSYINWNSGAMLTGKWDAPIRYGEINWYRYRGTSAVKLSASTGRVVPRLTNQSMFMTVIAPADTVDAVNTLGIPFYMSSAEIKRDADIIGRVMSAQTNQLFVNLKPDACVKLTTN